MTAKFKFKLLAKQKNNFEERDEIGTNVKIFLKNKLAKELLSLDF